MTVRLGETKKTLKDSAFWKILLKTEQALMIICSSAMALLIVFNVVLRYVFNQNFYGSEEIILIFAFWLYFLGAAYGSMENSHIKADLANVYIKNQRAKEGVALIAMMVTTTVNLIILKWALDYMIWDIIKMPKSTGLKIPLIVPQSAIFVGLALMAFYHVYYLVTGLRAYFKNEPPPAAVEERGENE